MSKEIIEQIEKIDGILSIGVDGDDSNTLTVTIKPKKIAIICKNKDQWEFLQKKCGILTGWRDKEYCINPKGSVGSIETYDKLRFDIISFKKYLTDFGFHGDYLEFLAKRNQRKLIDGEIYFINYKDSDNRIVRYVGMDGNNDMLFYSQYSKLHGFFEGTCFDADYDGSLSLFSANILDATKKQKKKLIKAEIKNGYFYELEK